MPWTWTLILRYLVENGISNIDSHCIDDCPVLFPLTAFRLKVKAWWSPVYIALAMGCRLLEPTLDDSENISGNNSKQACCMRCTSHHLQKSRTAHGNAPEPVFQNATVADDLDLDALPSDDQ
jgi:hypothetical protein